MATTPSRLRILPQPNDTTCGPTCLQAVYGFFGDELPLDQVIEECRTLEGGGTLGVFLGQHALRRGYRARLITANLQVFDPSWFADDGSAEPGHLIERLRAQAAVKPDPRLQVATRAYLEFLEQGGELLYEDLTPALLRRYLEAGCPVLTGLSATYLYGNTREIGEDNHPDDLLGEPVGHFVVLASLGADAGQIDIADPLLGNPYSDDHHYTVDEHRVLASILIGVLTYDANLLVIDPKRPSAT
ncbi:MAG TPA: hypothetical protein VGC54_01910 [Planctomycetota bacterium]